MTKNSDRPKESTAGENPYKDCGTTPDVISCALCKEPIPRGAKVCKVCKAYQNSWPRRLLLAGTMAPQVVAVLAIVSNILLISTLLDTESHTDFRVASADNTEIHLRIWNSGKKASSLLSFQLTFDDVDVGPVVLMVNPDDEDKVSVIEPGNPITVLLNAPHTPDLQLHTKSGIALSPQDALVRIGNSKKMRMEVEIQESDGVRPPVKSNPSEEWRNELRDGVQKFLWERLH